MPLQNLETELQHGKLIGLPLFEHNNNKAIHSAKVGSCVLQFSAVFFINKIFYLISALTKHVFNSVCFLDGK